MADGTQADQALASNIRNKFPQGILICLSIPLAYSNKEDAEEAVDNNQITDPYPWRTTWEKKGRVDKDETVLQKMWSWYLEGNKSAVTPKKPVDNKATKLPEKYADAPDDVKTKFIDSVSKAFGNDIPDDLKAALKDRYAKNISQVAYQNNAHIVNRANDFAKNHSAIALDNEKLSLGKYMTYNTYPEISEKVNTVHESVSNLLKQYPENAIAQEDRSDEAISLVKHLAIFAHGSPKWLGGHGKARSAGFTGKKVEEIVNGSSGMPEQVTGDKSSLGLAYAVADSVVIRFFACGTARDPDVKKSSDYKSDQTHGEGSLADKFRDALVTSGKKDAMVVGHITTGTVDENPNTRFFFGQQASNKKAGEDWTYEDAISDGFYDRETLRLGFYQNSVEHKEGDQENIVAEVPDDLKIALKNVLKEDLSKFFVRESWTMDFSSLRAGATGENDLTSLRKDFEERWQKNMPIPSKEIRNKMASHNKKHHKK